MEDGSASKRKQAEYASREAGAVVIKRSSPRGFAAKLILWLLILSNAALIFYFSSETAEESSQTSGRVVETVVKLAVNDFDKLPPAQKEQVIARYQIPVRKMAHVLEFALLGFLLSLTLAQYPLRLALRVPLVLLIALVIAVFDESFQRGVLGRGPAFTDLGYDMLGAVFGSVAAMVFKRVRRGVNP